MDLGAEMLIHDKVEMLIHDTFWVF